MVDYDFDLMHTVSAINCLQEFSYFNQSHYLVSLHVFFTYCYIAMLPLILNEYFIFAQ